MKRFLLTVLTLASIALLNYSCQDETIVYVREESGELKAKFELKVEVESIDPARAGKAAITRSGEIVPTDDFIVTIYKASNNEKIGNWRYSEMPEILTLLTGRYRIEAQSDFLKDAAWEEPYYFGSREFDIVKSSVTQINDMVCTLQNVKVGIYYAQNLLDELESFSVTVENGRGVLEFSREETRYGYFTAAPLTITLNGVRHDGERVNHVEKITTVRAGEFHKVTLNVVLVGDLNASLRVDVSTVLIEKGVEIPLEEDVITDPDNPGGGGTDPTPDPDPVLSITGRNGLNINQPITYAQGNVRQVIVDIVAETGIYDLWVEIDSPFLTDELLGEMGLPKRFNLADLTPELQEVFGPDNLGLIGRDPVRNSTNLVFDITNFTNLLDINTHKFIITLKDNNNTTKTQVLTLQPQ